MSSTLRVADSGVSYNSWGDGTVRIPGGVILGLSIVIFDSRQSVYLSSLTVSDNVLSLTLSQNGKVIAHGTTDKEDSVLFLETKHPCSSAQVCVGSFRGLDIKTSKQSKINPACILVAPAPAVAEARIRVVQDGVEDIAILNKDYNLVVDYRFSADYSEESKTLTLSLPEEVHRELMVSYSYAEPAVDKIVTINHTKPDKDGVVHLEISNGSGVLTFNLSENAPVLTIGSDMSPCVEEDIIDSYIAPNIVRTFSYMPLDEAYAKDEETKKYVRDTFTLLADVNKIDEMFG